jgi:hypothetical protein
MRGDQLPVVVSAALMRRVSKRLVVLVVVTLVALLAPPLASTTNAGPAVAGLECGQDVTTDVVLTHDLHCPTFEAFDVVAPGVTVDLGGHTVTVTREPYTEGCGWIIYGDPGPCSITLFADSVSLTNGRLVGVEVGVIDSRSVDLSRLWVEDSVLFLTGARLHDSVVVDSRIELFGESGGPTVDRNWLHGTPLWMDNLQYGVTDLRVDSNIIDHSPEHGIELHLTCGCYRPGDVTGSITRNLVLGSALDGIYVAPGSDYPAEALAGLGELTVTSNVLVGNGGDGFEMWGTTIYDASCACPTFYEVGGPIVMGGNAAFFNGGHGLTVHLQPNFIDGVGWVESGGFVDGGGNRAAFNGLRPACVGVSCRRW